jgi:3-dehydroquinate dehydratase/shikimate dehydrogenase
MICVTLGRSRHKRMIAEHQHLVEQGAKLVELRLDYIGRAVNLKRLLDERPGPVVVTVRRRQDGGRWMKSEEERLMLLRNAIAAGAEYVDIESDVADQIPRYGDTKRIISLHDIEETPKNLSEINASLSELDADIVKIATMARSFSDNVRMINMLKNAKVPTIGICMGEVGTLTRLVAKRYGSPFTYATFQTGKSMAPGQFDWKEMQDLYRYEDIDEQTEFFCVIADPVAHSYSPMIYNRAFEDQGLNARYLPIRVPKSDLPNFLRDCTQVGIQGASVTIPHKEQALVYCDQAESSATGIGAVNTLVFDNRDCLGYNTDYRAAMECIEDVFKVNKKLERPMQGVTAMILGAGGVARAIAWGLRQRAAEVLICSRNYERSQMICAELGCRAIEWEFRHDARQRVNLLVNGTPVGMHPHVDASPFDSTAMNQYMVVFDTVYNPENTLLIKKARQMQCRTITGLDMFVRQASYQYQIFTGQEAPVELLKKTIREATNPVKMN